MGTANTRDSELAWVELILESDFKNTIASIQRCSTTRLHEWIPGVGIWLSLVCRILEELGRLYRLLDAALYDAVIY